MVEIYRVLIFNFFNFPFRLARDFSCSFERCPYLHTFLYMRYLFFRVHSDMLHRPIRKLGSYTKTLHLNSTVVLHSIWTICTNTGTNVPVCTLFSCIRTSTETNNIHFCTLYKYNNNNVCICPVLVQNLYRYISRGTV